MSNLIELRRAYAPKLVGKPKSERIIKWPWVLAVLAIAVGDLGLHLTGKMSDRKAFHTEFAAERQSEIDKLSAIPADEITQTQRDELDRAKRRKADDEERAEKMRSKVTTSYLITGGGFSGALGLIILAVVLQRRRRRAPD